MSLAKLPHLSQRPHAHSTSSESRDVVAVSFGPLLAGNLLSWIKSNHCLNLRLRSPQFETNSPSNEVNENSLLLLFDPVYGSVFPVLSSATSSGILYAEKPHACLHSLSVLSYLIAYVTVFRFRLRYLLVLVGSTLLVPDYKPDT